MFTTTSEDFCPFDPVLPTQISIPPSRTVRHTDVLHQKIRLYLQIVTPVDRLVSPTSRRRRVRFRTKETVSK